MRRTRWMVVVALFLTVCAAGLLSVACGNDAAVDGACDDGVACTRDAYDEDAKRCTHVPDDTQCEAGPVCTVATCDPGAGCVYDTAPDGALCDDSDRCTESDACTAGTCGGTPVDLAPEVTALAHAYPTAPLPYGDGLLFHTPDRLAYAEHEDGLLSLRWELPVGAALYDWDDLYGSAPPIYLAGSRLVSRQLDHFSVLDLGPNGPTSRVRFPPLDSPCQTGFATARLVGEGDRLWYVTSNRFCRYDMSGDAPALEGMTSLSGCAGVPFRPVPMEFVRVGAGHLWWPGRDGDTCVFSFDGGGATHLAEGEVYGFAAVGDEAVTLLRSDSFEWTWRRYARGPEGPVLVAERPVDAGARLFSLGEVTTTAGAIELVAATYTDRIDLVDAATFERVGRIDVGVPRDQRPVVILGGGGLVAVWNDLELTAWDVTDPAAPQLLYSAPYTVVAPTYGSGLLALNGRVVRFDPVTHALAVVPGVMQSSGHPTRLPSGEIYLTGAHLQRVDLADGRPLLEWLGPGPAALAVRDGDTVRLSGYGTGAPPWTVAHVVSGDIANLGTIGASDTMPHRFGAAGRRFVSLVDVGEPGAPRMRLDVYDVPGPLQSLPEAPAGTLEFDVDSLWVDAGVPLSASGARAAMLLDGAVSLVDVQDAAAPAVVGTSSLLEGYGFTFAGERLLAKVGGAIASLAPDGSGGLEATGLRTGDDTAGPLWSDGRLVAYHRGDGVGFFDLDDPSYDVQLELPFGPAAVVPTEDGYLLVGYLGLATTTGVCRAP